MLRWYLLHFTTTYCGWASEILHHLKTVVSLYSLSHYWVEKPSFLVQHFTTIHRLLTGFPSYHPRPLDRETDQRKQLFVSSKKKQWTWKSDWENDYICVQKKNYKIKKQTMKTDWVRVWYFTYIYIYKWHENLHKKHGEFHQHSICWVHPKMTGSNYLWSWSKSWFSLIFPC